MFLTKKVYLRRCVIDSLRITEPFLDKVDELCPYSLPSTHRPEISNCMEIVLRSLTKCPDRFYWTNDYTTSTEKGGIDIEVRGEIKIENKNEAYGEWTITWLGLCIVHKTERIVLSKSGGSEWRGP